MFYKYCFLVSSSKYDKLISKDIYTNCLKYDQLRTIIYNNLRNFNKLYNQEITTESIGNCIIDNVIRMFETNPDNESCMQYNVYIHIWNEINKVDITITTNDKSYVDYKEVVPNDTYSGNCVTTFINNVMEPNIAALTTFCNDIKYRHLDRVNEKEYHDSITYEKDYSQILKIKNISEKLVELCNKELQILSDKYTK